MARHVVELELPEDLEGIRLPSGVNERLQSLLDRQDEGEPLTPGERKEAEGLVNLAEFLSITSIACTQGLARKTWVSRVSPELRLVISQRAGGRCEYCRLAQDG